MVNGEAFTPTAQAAKIYKSPGIHPSAARWAAGLERPFTGTPEKCPWNFNPVPSYLSFVATTVASRVGADSVSANRTTQFTFMPGHAKLATPVVGNAGGTVVSAVTDMDEVAYHYLFQTFPGPITLCWGPVPFIDPFGVTRVAVCCAQDNDIATGTTVTTSAASVPIGWNATVPFTGDLRTEGHTRVKLLSMGIRFVNTTPEQFRGGSFVSWQPVTVTDIQSPQTSNTINPSWKDHGPDGCEVTWIPRMRDLAYWHPSTASVAAAGVPAAPLTDTALAGPGVVVCINNPTSSVQTYDMECVAHWEISGFSVQTISTSAKATNLSDSTLKSALSSQINNAPDASGFAKTLTSAVHGVVQAGQALGKAAPRLAAASAAAGALM